MNWNTQLIKAAQRRATVTLRDGKKGVLVYAPNPQRKPNTAKRPRHGDVTKCGVRLSDATPDWIAPVDPKDIIEIEDP